MKKVLFGIVALSLLVMGISSSAMATAAEEKPCVRTLDVSITVKHICKLAFVKAMPTTEVPTPGAVTALDLGTWLPGETATGPFYIFSAANFAHSLSFSWDDGGSGYACTPPSGYSGRSADWPVGTYDAFSLSVLVPATAVAGGPVAAGVLTATIAAAI